MNTKTLISLLQQPDLLKSETLFEVEKIIEAYPFFQAPKALHLKGLKNQESYRYNTALKNTAAYTADRHVLFDFITSDAFRRTEEVVSLSAVEKEVKLEEIDVLDSEELQIMPSVSLDSAVAMKMQEADEVLDPELFITVIHEMIAPESLNEEVAPEEILQPNKPLEFDRNESHSFGQWLKLASLQPIQREHELGIVNDLTPEISENEEENVGREGLNREDKFRLIDNFISKKPKIGPVSSDASSFNLVKQKDTVQDTLMTETLAKVYVAQKNYKKAIQAYNILILKNPEKSGFFADQIRAIKKIQDHK